MSGRQGGGGGAMQRMARTVLRGRIWQMVEMLCNIDFVLSLGDVSLTASLPEQPVALDFGIYDSR